MTRALLALLLLAAGCTPAANTVPSGAPSSAGTLPEQLTFSADSGRAAEVTVTFSDGGTVSAAAADGSTFELVVPPLAIAGDTLIRMTPLTDVQGLGDGAVHAVQLEPEGLLFFEFARLTITPATPIPVADQLMFEATGDGSDAGPALVDPAAEPIVLLLEHFTIEGVAEVTPQQRALFLEKSASNAERRIASEIRDRFQAERQRQLLGASDGGTPDISDLVAEYEREVVEKRRAAAALSCTALRTYVQTVISIERARQLLGLTAAEEAASNARILEAVGAATARYQACEKEAIAQCQAAKDPSILVAFWLAMEQPTTPAMAERAKQICEPQGYQFEFSGSGTGTDRFGAQVEVVWHYWGLLCEGSEQWKIWENFRSEGEMSSVRVDTGPPGADQLTGPFLVTFGEDGAVTHGSWPGYADGDRYLQQSQPRATISGTTFTLTPPDEPTEVRAEVPVDITSIPVTAPVEPADGTIGSCEPAKAP